MKNRAELWEVTRVTSVMLVCSAADSHWSRKFLEALRVCQWLTAGLFGHMTPPPLCISHLRTEPRARRFHPSCTGLNKDLTQFDTPPNLETVDNVTTATSFVSLVYQPFYDWSRTPDGSLTSDLFASADVILQCMCVSKGDALYCSWLVVFLFSNVFLRCDLLSQPFPLSLTHTHAHTHAHTQS